GSAVVSFACLTKSGPAMKSISACLNSSRELYMDDLLCACVFPVVRAAEVDHPGEQGLPLRVRQPSSPALLGAFGREDLGVQQQRQERRRGIEHAGEDHVAASLDRPTE